MVTAHGIFWVNIMSYRKSLPPVFHFLDSKIIAILIVLDTWYARIDSPYLRLFACASHKCRFALLLELHLNQPSKQQYKIPLSSMIITFALNCFLLLKKDSYPKFLTLSFSASNFYFCSFSIFPKMNRTSSSSSLPSSNRSSTLSSSSDGPIHAPTSIILLRVVHDNDILLVNDISSMLTKRDIDR